VVVVPLQDIIRKCFGVLNISEAFASNLVVFS